MTPFNFIDIYKVINKDSKMLLETITAISVIFVCQSFNTLFPNFAFRTRLLIYIRNKFNPFPVP